MTRLWRLFLAVAMIAAMLTPFSAQPAAAQEAADYELANGWFFTQTAGDLVGTGKGFAITDDGDIPFWSTFEALGGIDVLGYPVSNRFVYDGFVVQATQRVILQWQPGQGMFFLNVFDILSDRGDDTWLESVRQTPPPFDNSEDAGLTFEQVVQRHQEMLDLNPAIREVYFDNPDPVLNYGLPMSYRDYGNVFVIRAQRAVFQYWKEDVPWASAGEVTIALGGDIAKERGLIPAEAATPSDPPSGTATPIPTAPASPRPATGGFAYGFQIDPGSDLNRALDMTSAAGFNWVKVQLRWESLESSKGNINWGYIDGIVDAAQARGLNILFSIPTAPAWSRPQDTDFSVPGPPANLQDYADFVGAIAARHKGKIGAIEVWNEQNLWYEWGGTGGKINAAEYVRMLELAYKAIKAADPNIIVISGAPTPTGVNDGNVAIDDLTYLQQMYAAGLKQWSDAIGAHPSGFNNAPTDDPNTNSAGTTNFKGHWSFYFRNFERYYEVMVANGDGDKKIWFTEFGWASSPNPYPEYDYARQVSEQRQAEWIVQAFQYARNSGYVGGAMLWNLNFAPGAEDNDRYAKLAFSIINRDYSPRPAYHALVQMPKN